MEQLPHNNTETANVPHAGNLPEGMRELPVQEFDNTTLHEAAHGNNPDGTPIIKMPDNAADLIPKKSRKALYGVIGSAVTVLIAGGAIFGISQAKNNGPDTDGPIAEAPLDPSAEPAEEVPFGEMPANPIPVETPPADPETDQTDPDSFEVYGLPSLAELEINANQSDEQIAENIVAVQNAWAASGANEEMYNLQYENGNDFLTQTEYIKKITDASDPIFIEALYGDKANDETFRKRIETQKEIHAAYILAHFQTYGAQSNVPFEQTEEFLDVNVVDSGDGTKTMHVRTELKDNADQNIVEPSNSGTITRISYVTAEVDGKIKIVENPNVVVQSR
jgi:hypothetical protein